jgi:hypothetical protein
MDFKDYAKRVREVKETRETLQFAQGALNENASDGDNQRLLERAQNNINQINTNIQRKGREVMSAQAMVVMYENEVTSLQSGTGIGPISTQQTLATANLNRAKTDLARLQSELSALRGELKEAQDLKTESEKLRGQNVLQSRALQEDFGRCLQEVIQNPMSLVTSGLQGATGYALDNLQNSDEIGEIAQIFISMAGTFLQSGLSSLRADFRRPSSPIGGPEQLVTSSGGNVNWTQAPTVVVDLRNEFGTALETTRQEIQLIQQYNELLLGVTAAPTSGTPARNFADITSTLDYCIPGPDFNYAERIESYIARKTGKLENSLGSGNENKQDRRATAKDRIDTSVDAALSDLEIWYNQSEKNIPGIQVMRAQVAKIEDVRSIYQRKRTLNIERQSALNILTQIEGKLRQSLRLLPQGIIPDSISDSVPFTFTDWNQRTALQRNSYLNWARTQTIISDEDFALFTEDKKFEFFITQIWNVWENPESFIARNTENSSEASLVWEFGNATSEMSLGEDYLSSSPTIGTVGQNPQPAQTQSERFLAIKNEIRSDFSAITNRVSNRISVAQARSDNQDLWATILRSTSMIDDCRLMRTIVQDSASYPTVYGVQAHNELRKRFNERRTEFKIPEIRDAVTNLGTTSILSTNPTNYPTGMICDYSPTQILNLPVNACLSPSRNFSMTVIDKQNGQTILNDTEMPEIEDNGDEEAFEAAYQQWAANFDPDAYALLLSRLESSDVRRDFELRGGNRDRYQINPAKNIWDIFLQDTGRPGRNVFLCPFNVYLSNYNTDKNIRGKPVLCSTSDSDAWYHLKPNNVVSYIFKENLNTPASTRR